MNDTRGTKGSLRLAIAALLAACLLALCAVLPQNAWAANPVAETNDGKTHETLEDAFKSLEGKDGTVTLLQDATVTETILVSGGKSATLNMNGKSIYFESNKHIWIEGGKLSIVNVGKDNGETLTTGGLLKENLPYFSPLIMKGSADDVANYSVVSIGKGVTSQGWAGLFIDQNKKKNYGIVAKVSGKLMGEKDTGNASGFGLYVNGQIDNVSGNVPQITLDGAVLEAASGNGMYLAGYADTTAKNSTISASAEGGAGIEIRAGKLLVENCIVKGGSGTYEVNANGNGTTSNNVGIAAIQHGTKLPLEVTVRGDNTSVSGTKALTQTNPQKNSEEDIAKVKLDIANGVFSGTGTDGEILDIENCTSFISGGTFSSDPSAYLAADHVAQVDSNTSYAVMQKTNLKPGTYKTVSGETVETKDLAAESCPKAITTSDADTYTIGEHQAAADKTNVKAATCTEEGYTGDAMCTACGAVATKGETIPAAGHKFSGGKCSVCGAIDPAYANINVIVDDQEGVSTSEQAAAEQVAAATASSIVQAALGIEGATDPVEAGIVDAETFAAVKEAVENNKTIDVVIEAEPIAPETVPSADKKKIVEVIDGGTIAQYLDLSVMLMANGKKLGTIDKLEEPVKFTVAIPAELIKDGRTFYVARVHDGKAEKLPTTVENGFATFETDRFSTYALAYEDTQAADGQASSSAQTGDETPLMFFAALAAAALATIVCITVFRKRRSN